MKDLYNVIKKPLITEKSDIQKGKFNQVIFEVNSDANKVEIKRAVERLFKVKVLNVNTSSIRGKPKRLGKNVGRRKDWKKAIVTLKPGDHIDFFEGV
ncbi:MAG: 50S ribosomal protein L23 [Pseudomonadota bacterium]